MREFHGSATTRVRASAADVFDLITDLDRLADWNSAIDQIVERPTALTPGVEWVIVMHPAGMPKWRSRSHLEAIEPGVRFVYRTHTDDSNPSFALWRWELEPIVDGVQLTVSWDVYPKTIGRRLFTARLRRRMLKSEVAASLEAIRRTLEPVPTDAT